MSARLPTRSRHRQKQSSILRDNAIMRPGKTFGRRQQGWKSRSRTYSEVDIQAKRESRKYGKQRPGVPSKCRGSKPITKARKGRNAARARRLNKKLLAAYSSSLPVRKRLRGKQQQPEPYILPASFEKLRDVLKKRAANAGEGFTYKRRRKLASHSCYRAGLLPDVGRHFFRSPVVAHPSPREAACLRLGVTLQ